MCAGRARGAGARARGAGCAYAGAEGAPAACGECAGGGAAELRASVESERRWKPPTARSDSTKSLRKLWTQKKCEWVNIDVSF